MVEAEGGCPGPLPPPEFLPAQLSELLQAGRDRARAHHVPDPLDGRGGVLAAAAATEAWQSRCS